MCAYFIVSCETLSEFNLFDLCSDITLSTYEYSYNEIGKKNMCIEKEIKCVEL